MNELDVIPTQVSARQGHSSKKRAEQGSEAVLTLAWPRALMGAQVGSVALWPAAISVPLQLPTDKSGSVCGCFLMKGTRVCLAGAPLLTLMGKDQWKRFFSGLISVNLGIFCQQVKQVIP